jgi:iron complex transport system substrate-binding protein
LPSIGYQRQLSAEGILSLRPDVLVGTEEMGPPPVLAQIRKAGVRVELFSSKAELPAVDENLKHLGQLLGSEQQAATLASDYHRQLKGCRTRSSRPRPARKHRACCCWSGTPGPSR